MWMFNNRSFRCIYSTAMFLYFLLELLSSDDISECRATCPSSEWICVVSDCILVFIRKVMMVLMIRVRYICTVAILLILQVELVEPIGNQTGPTYRRDPACVCCDVSRQSYL